MRATGMHESCSYYPIVQSSSCGERDDKYQRECTRNSLRSRNRIGVIGDSYFFLLFKPSLLLSRVFFLIFFLIFIFYLQAAVTVRR